MTENQQESPVTETGQVTVGGVTVTVEVYRGELFVHVGNADMEAGTFPAAHPHAHPSVGRISVRAAGEARGSVQGTPRLYLYPQPGRP